MTAPRTELGAMLAANPLDEDLVEFFAGWSVDELDVLGFVAERLNLGRERYGSLELATDAREWVREGHEEAIDLAVYRAIAVMGRELLPAANFIGDGSTAEEEDEVAVHSCVAAIRKDRSARDVGLREPGDEWECVCGQVFVVDPSGGCAKRVPEEEMNARLRVPAPWEVPPASTKPGKGSRFMS